MALLVALLGLPAFAQATEYRGIPSVIDGDTLDIHGHRIRLHGIDAPESSQRCQRNGEDWRCGRDAAFALSEKIGRAQVRCQKKDTDRYGRIIAVCYKGDEDLNAWLVSDGWAMAYLRYSKDYTGQEISAKSDRRGIWGSEFIPPWEWRKNKKNH